MSSDNQLHLTEFTGRFSYIIDKIKEKYKVNQKDIAEHIGLSTAALSQLKSGHSKSATGNTLGALQSKFLVSIPWLTRHEGEPFITKVDQPATVENLVGIDGGEEVYSSIDYSGLILLLKDLDLDEFHLKGIRHWIKENTKRIEDYEKDKVQDRITKRNDRLAIESRDKIIDELKAELRKKNDIIGTLGATEDKPAKYFFAVFTFIDDEIKVSFPDIKACATVGKNFDEAYSNAVERLAECIAKAKRGTVNKELSSFGELTKKYKKKNQTIVPIPVNSDLLNINFEIK